MEKKMDSFISNPKESIQISREYNDGIRRGNTQG